MGEGKKVYLPKIDIREGLTWWEISPCHLPETGTLWEPSPDLSVRRSLGDVGLFLVPGRAFDLKGTRLGRGGGHYDRALAKRGRTACVMGIFFAQQQVEQILRNPMTFHCPMWSRKTGGETFVKDSEKPFLEHVEDLRGVILKCVVAIGAGSILGVFLLGR